MGKLINNKLFLQSFKFFFERLHNAVTGSKKIVELNCVTIFEVTLSGKGHANFYLFHGSRKELNQLFPKDTETAYCYLRSFASTLCARFDDVIKEFNCDFGYVIVKDELVKSWQKSDKSKGAAEWAAVQICSHEIRHEIQLHHSLARSQFRTSFPEMKPSPWPKIKWTDLKREFEELYHVYVQKHQDPEYLARELDAIITSYLALKKWFDEEGDYEVKLQRLEEVISG